MNKNALILSLIILPITVSLIWGNNNVIEIRNDNSGSEYFYCAMQPSPIQPQEKYFLESKNPDVWVGTTGIYNNRTVTELLHWAIEIEYDSDDGLSPGTTFSLLINRNIPTGSYIDYVCCTRDTEGCAVSKAYGNHQADWDFVVSEKNTILANAGLTDASPERDKAMAMAEHIIALPAGVFNTCHPVDTLKQGDHCTGYANTMVALCSVMGIPGRVISTKRHTVSEVFIDGQWCFVENDTGALNQIPGEYEQGPLFTYSLLELIADRDRYGFPDTQWTERDWTCVTDGDGMCLFYNLESCTNWVFNLEGDYPGSPGIRLDHTPASAHVISALYPEKTTIEYKCQDGAKMWLTPFHGYWKGDCGKAKQVNQNNGVKKNFYISTLDGVTGVKACLLLEDYKTNNIPSDGGDWYYLVNGGKYYLRDYGGWVEHQTYEGVGGYNYVVFDVPLDSLNTSTGSPSVSITSPENGEVVSNSVNITVDASDTNGISKVEFYIDNILKHACTTLPYSWSWDTTEVSNGIHSVKAVAYSTIGGIGRNQIDVTVSNNLPTLENPLDSVKIYPNPYVPGAGSVTFADIPQGATLKIYTLSGKPVRELSEGGGLISWNGQNSGGINITRGLYLYILNDGTGNRRIGKITIR